MRCLIKHVTRRPNGGLSQRPVTADTAVLRFGRGTDNEVHLEDLRVPLNACRLTEGPDGFRLDSFGTFELRHRGRPVRALILHPDDEIMVGPYRVLVLPPELGFELVLAVELAAPPTGDLDRLLANSQLSLAATLPSRRALSWLSVLAILVVFFALPLAVSQLDRTPPKEDRRVPLDMVWQSGPLTQAHARLGASCQSCHQDLFVQVRDAACTACHTDVGNHVDPRGPVQMAALTETRCETCHKEHGAHALLVRTDSALCVDCHGDLRGQVPETGLADVSDFDRTHPEFSPSVVVEPFSGQVRRETLGGTPPVEASGLLFPHDAHLKPQGIRAPEGTRRLDCGSCHQPEPGGAGMVPVDMERDCADCHRLRFERFAPERVLPHGKPAEVNAMVRDFYAKAGLDGGFPDPEGPPAIRRRPGTPLDPEAIRDVVQWSEQRAEAALRFVYGKSLCGSCHVVQSPAESATGEWDVAPVQVTEHWLPRARFDHARHRTMDCGACHAAETSKSSSDVLLPRIGECRTCHATEGAAAMVPSPCVACHRFHDPAHGRMRPVDTTELRAR